MRTHHISLLTRDAQQNIDFYTRVLGMRLVKNTVNQEISAFVTYSTVTIWEHQDQW